MATTDPLLSSINTAAGFGTAPTATADPYQLGVTNFSGYNVPNSNYDASIAAGVASGAPTYVDPAVAAANAATASRNAAIDSQLGRLDNQGRIGHGNIGASYDSAYQRLVNGKTEALGHYGDARTQTDQDNIKARAGVQDSVHNQLTGLQRLLGSRGAGASSAASFLAPYAAGQQGNAQYGQVQDAYGRNLNSIDTAVSDYNRNFDDSAGDLKVQRENQDRGLDANLLGTRASLLASRSNAAANQGTIDALGNQIDGLGANSVYTPKAVNYAAPNLAKYDFNNPGAATLSNNPVAQQTGSFYNLLNPQDKLKTGAITA